MNIRLKFRTTINHKLSIKADRLRLEELLTNIFENSAKYCQQDCKITIDAEQTNNFVTISISR